MLNFLGRSGSRFCDGLSRRDFLQVGSMALGGLTLADVLRADATPNAAGKKPKSIIKIYLRGGPPHIDMFDMKPDAPSEIRGPYKPIASTVPGLEVCELMPKLAQMAHKYSIVRSVTGSVDEHQSQQCDSGWPQRGQEAIGGRPGVGAVVQKLQGPKHGCPITSVSMGRNPNRSFPGPTSPGYLGPAFNDFEPDGPGRANLRLNFAESQLHDRMDLLTKLDKFNRQADASGSMSAMDSFTQKALGVFTSAQFADALDIDKEDRSIRDLYGLTETKGQSTKVDPEFGEINSRAVIAARLIEAGVRVVSFSWMEWDTHSNHFTTQPGTAYQGMTDLLPKFDVMLSGLLTDLERRGLLDDTIVMCCGEFGRTPRINKNAGRDHWTPASFVFLAGGGIKPGQVVGATDRLAAQVTERPVHIQNVIATVYRLLGVDTATILHDLSGRPQFLLDHQDVIGELI